MSENKPFVLFYQVKGSFYSDNIHWCCAIFCTLFAENRFAYGPANATATLAPVKSRLVLVPPHPGNPGQSWEDRKTDLSVCSENKICLKF